MATKNCQIPIPLCSESDLKPYSIEEASLGSPVVLRNPTRMQKPKVLLVAYSLDSVLLRVESPFLESSSLRACSTWFIQNDTEILLFSVRLDLPPFTSNSLECQVRLWTRSFATCSRTQLDGCLGYQEPGSSTVSRGS